MIQLSHKLGSYCISFIPTPPFGIDCQLLINSLSTVLVLISWCVGGRGERLHRVPCWVLLPSELDRIVKSHPVFAWNLLNPDRAQFGMPLVRCWLFLSRHNHKCAVHHRHLLFRRRTCISAVPSWLLLPNSCAAYYVPCCIVLSTGLQPSVPVPTRILLSTNQLCAHAVHRWPLLREQQLLSAAMPCRHVLLQGRSLHAFGLFIWHILVQLEPHGPMPPVPSWQPLPYSGVPQHLHRRLLLPRGVYLRNTMPSRHLLPPGQRLQPFAVRERHVLGQRRADSVHSMSSLLSERHPAGSMPHRIKIRREQMCLQ